jgi:hypothetical protein
MYPELQQMEKVQQKNKKYNKTVQISFSLVGLPQKETCLLCMTKKLPPV